jgi:hypothetical protein
MRGRSSDREKRPALSTLSGASREADEAVIAC